MGFLKALEREGPTAQNINGQSHKSWFHCILGGHEKEGMHSECNSRVNVYYPCFANLGGPACAPVQFSQVVLKDEGVGVGLVGEQIRIIATATKTAPPPFLILLQSG